MKKEMRLLLLSGVIILIFIFVVNFIIAEPKSQKKKAPLLLKQKIIPSAQKSIFKAKPDKSRALPTEEPIQEAPLPKGAPLAS